MSMTQRQKTTYKDRATMYETLNYVKETEGLGIVIKGIPLDMNETIVVSYGDSG